MTDQKNLVLAIVLSILILVGFQFLFGDSMVPQRPADQATEQIVAAPEGANEGLTDPLDSPGRAGPTEVSPVATMSRAEALAQSPRVRIESPRVDGSLALVGGRID